MTNVVERSNDDEWVTLTSTYGVREVRGVPTMNSCHYCGAEDWFAWEDNVLCGECLSPETLPAVTYDNYLSLTAAEMELKRKRFVEGSEPDPHETPEYFDKMWRAKKVAERPRDLPPPFWHTIGD